MTIRRRLPDDLARCVTVMGDVHVTDGYPELWPADPAGFLDPPGTLAAWVAEDPDGQVNAHVCLIRAGADAHPVKLSRLFVAPAAQGRGLARRLMAASVDWATGQGLDVVLEVVEGTPAVAVYERLGWQYLSSNPAGWTMRDGSHPTVRNYAAPPTLPRDPARTL